jgi:hypothetical protein
MSRAAERQCRGTASGGSGLPRRPAAGTAQAMAHLDYPGTHRAPGAGRPWAVNAEAALIELELSWRPAGYHDFRLQDGVYSAGPGDEDVFTGSTPDTLGQEIRKHWLVRQ